MQKTQVLSLGQENVLEKGMATHSSTLAWRIPWMGESLGSRVGHDWAINTLTFMYAYIKSIHIFMYYMDIIGWMEPTLYSLVSSSWITDHLSCFNSNSTPPKLGAWHGQPKWSHLRSLSGREDGIYECNKMFSEGFWWRNFSSLLSKPPGEIPSSRSYCTAQIQRTLLALYLI